MLDLMAEQDLTLNKNTDKLNAINHINDDTKLKMDNTAVKLESLAMGVTTFRETVTNDMIQLS
jgi:hypothetical protein